MHVNIFSPSFCCFRSTLSCGETAVTPEGESVCLHPRGGMHGISTSQEFPYHFLFFSYLILIFFFFILASSHPSSSGGTPHLVKHCKTRKKKKRRVAPSTASSHWPLGPRSLCDWPGLSSCVCVGPLQPSEPPLPPLRKQTVSLASTGGAIEPPAAPSPCFLWANTRTRSCSWASSSSSATSSCGRPAAGEQEVEEEEEGAWPCLFFFSSLLVAAASVLGGPTLVCMQDDSPSLWHWTDGMMGME